VPVPPVSVPPVSVPPVPVPPEGEPAGLESLRLFFDGREGWAIESGANRSDSRATERVGLGCVTGIGPASGGSTGPGSATTGSAGSGSSTSSGAPVESAFCGTDSCAGGRSICGASTINWSTFAAGVGKAVGTPWFDGVPDGVSNFPLVAVGCESPVEDGPIARIRMTPARSVSNLLGGRARDQPCQPLTA
jgi:hypothetical protein